MNNIEREMEQFALQVSYIVGLQSNGKYEELEAYQLIKKLWKRLKKTKKEIQQDGRD